MSKRWVTLIGLLVALVLVAAACSDSDSDSTTTAGSETTEAAAPETTAAAAPETTAAAAEEEMGATIVAFIPTTTNTYIAEWARGAQDQAGELGYDLVIIENDFDQAEQDTQVQQQIGAADENVVAYAWWPSDNEAGVASLQALSETGTPVIQTNQLPFAGSEGFVVGYAGVDDKLNGRVAAELVVEARDYQLEQGVELSSEGGNAIIIGFVPGYQAGIDRSGDAIPILEDAGIVVLDSIDSGFGPAEGYDGTKQLVAANGDAGIDLVYAHNSALAEGVIQALEEDGYTPGVDVMVVGGTCHGNLAELEEGKEFATGLQAARLEGVFSINTLDEFLTTGSLAEFGNFIPNPPVHSPVYTDENEIESVTVEGFTVAELCVY